MKDLTKKKIFLLAGLVLFVSLAPAAVHIPSGKNILPNGQFFPGEWQDAVEVKENGGVVLLFKQDETYLYLGIKFIAEMHTGVDCYLADGAGSCKKLHVSSALGEAERQGDAWAEIRWGENSLWTANAVGLIVEDGKRKTVPLQGFEFQIDKSLFSAVAISLMIHLKRPEKIFPVAANPLNPDSWLHLELDKKDIRSRKSPNET